MTIEFIPYNKRFLSEMTQTWNDILIDGEAFQEKIYLIQKILN